MTPAARRVNGTRFEFRLLGPLAVERNSTLVSLGGLRQRALLALLLLHANETVPRERLIDGLWGEDPPETAPNALQVAVHALRKLLGAERILTRGSAYELRVEPRELDLDLFRGLVERARGERPAAAADTLREALALWQGPALADLGEVPFARAERERLEDLRLAALEQRIEADLALGRQVELVGEIEALVREYPFRERLRRQLMLALYRSGRQAEALEAYKEARRMLVDELGIEPGHELQELEQAILRQDPALAPPLVRPKERIPAPLTPLVGRRLELAAVTALLRSSEVRLLTLIGPGGTGKTRLALEAASEAAPDFPDGIFFVDLSPLTDPGLVATTIMHALELEERPGSPVVESLKEALRDKETLLLLDNFERVAEAGPLVTELLAAAPDVRALVTSRALLRVSGEHEYPVPPLSLPDPVRADDLETVARSEAVTLFVNRTRAVRPSFSLSRENARPVAEICLALDGLPLALELAAARSRLLSPEAMLERLERRLELLTVGARDLPARQQTLRATIEWSFELCSAEEQSLFGRLGVFVGGWTLEAAERVCVAELDTLASLIDKSLIRRRNGRFLMLETVREYALERLEASGEAERVRRRHAQYYRDLAGRAEEDLRAGKDSPTVYARLEVDLDNLRAALVWAEASGAHELMLETASALKLFWRVRGHLTEGRQWLEAALAHADAERTAARAKALEAAGALASRQGDYAATRAFWQQGLEIWRSLGDEHGIARCLGDLASVLDIEGQLEEAVALYEESAALCRKLGFTFQLATVVSNLGVCRVSQGMLDEAERLFEEAVELCRVSGRDEQLVISLFNLGQVETRQGGYERATDLFRQALTSARNLEYREMIAYCLMGSGEVLAARGEDESAAALLGVSDRLFEELGAHIEAAERELYERTVETLKERLGDAAFEAAYREGRALPLEQGIAIASGTALSAAVRPSRSRASGGA